jgi:hypothetical protein
VGEIDSGIPDRGCSRRRDVDLGLPGVGQGRGPCGSDCRGRRDRTPTCIKAHPGIREEMNCRAFTVRTLQRLGLNFEPVGGRSWPSGECFLATPAKRTTINRTRRYAHIAALRYDAVLPELLGMRKIVSEDAIRRAFKAIDETGGAVWRVRPSPPGRARRRDRVHSQGCRDRGDPLVPLHRGFDGLKFNGGLGGPRAQPEARCCARRPGSV